MKPVQTYVGEIRPGDILAGSHVVDVIADTPIDGGWRGPIAARTFTYTNGARSVALPVDHKVAVFGSAEPCCIDAPACTCAYESDLDSKVLAD